MTSPTSDGGAIRLGGLASGFDTEAIVDALLTNDQNRIDQLSETKEINTAKIQTWEDITDQLKSFSEVITSLKSDGTQGNTLYDDKIVSSSNTTVASGTAGTSAPAANYSLVVNTIAREHVAYGSQVASTFIASAGSFTINGTTITSTGSEGIEALSILISNADYGSNEPLVANVIDDRLVIQTRNSGAAAQITVDNDPDNIMRNELGLVNGALNLVNVAQTPEDADLTLNGVPITSTNNVIDKAIDGLIITMTATGSTTLNVAHDTEKIKAAITDFVDFYNETRDLIKRIREVKLEDDDEFGLFSSDPLMRQLFGEIRELTTSGIIVAGGDWDGSLTTQATSAGSSTITIDNFDLAATSLNEGDQFYISGHSQLYTLTSNTTIVGRSATVSFFPPLESAVTLGTQTGAGLRTLDEFGIGVRTDTVSGIEGIMGIIDEAALDEALATDVQGLKSIFSNFNGKSGGTGVARRLHDWVDDQIKISAFVNKNRSIDDITIPGIEERNDNIDKQILILEDNIERKRTSLIRRFAEMENAISESQAMGSAIGGLSASSGQ